MQIEDTTSLVDADAAAQSDLAEIPETAPSGLDADPDDKGDLHDVEPDEEVIELDDGLKLSVPKTQAQRIRDGWLRQSDYTKKTQELAEARRAFETERLTIQEASEAEMSAHALATGYGAQINALDQRAALFGGWSAWVRSDAAAAYESYIARSELDRARQEAMGNLAQLRQQRATNEQQESAKRVGEAAAILQREIGWGPAKAAELIEGGIREYQFEAVEIDRFEDARMVLALHDALQWRAHQRKEKAVSRHQAAQAARPAATVQARSAPPTGLDDQLPADEWIRRRNEQLRKRG